MILVLEALIALHSRAAAIRVDNGPELVAQAFVDWCEQRRVAIHYIQPGNQTKTPSSSASTAAIVRRPLMHISSSRLRRFAH